MNSVADVWQNVLKQLERELSETAISAWFDEVTVVDIRYLASDWVGRYVDFHGQDVLFLYSTLVLNSSNSLK